MFLFVGMAKILSLMDSNDIDSLYPTQGNTLKSYKARVKCYLLQACTDR